MAEVVIVPESEGPKRLENLLKKRYPIGYVRKLFRRKGVRVNGRRSGPQEIAYPGDEIERRLREWLKKEGLLKA